MKRERGFTIVEVIIAIIVLTVGLLGLVTTSALVTRMISRGGRSGIAAQYAAQRLEQLRATGCTSQASGTEVFYRGAVPVDTNKWRFMTPSPANDTYVVELIAKYRTTGDRWRTDTLETAISCLQ